MSKSIYSRFCLCQKHFGVLQVFQVLLSLLWLSVILPNTNTNNNNVAVAEPLINQLAALLRARPPWPTNFPSGTSTSSSSNSGGGGGESGETFADMINNQISKNVQLEDFTHFNELLTGQSINQLNQNQYEGDNGFTLQQLYPGVQILATSHPLPQLELPHGKGKTLIAHPVLGPNPYEPPEKVEHRFNGMMIHPYFLNDNLGLYSTKNENEKPKPSAVRTKNSFQNFSHKFNIFQPTHNNKYQQQVYQLPKVIPFSGKPPPGGKVIAIPVPVPSNSPFLQNQFYHGGKATPQIIAMRQPFPPITSITTPPPPPPPQLQQSAEGSQHVAKFMSKFSPSPLDMSSYYPTDKTNYTTTIPFTISSNTNSSTSSTAFTSTTSTFTYTTTPPTTVTTPSPKTTHHYSEQHTSSSSINDNFDSPSTIAITETTPTTPPLPTPQPLQQQLHNNIQEVIQNAEHASPSTLVGMFRFPDPPTPPNMMNMNTRYELQNKNVLNTDWVPKSSVDSSPSASLSTSSAIKPAYYTHTQNGNNNANGFFSSSISSIPLSQGSKSKWKHEDSETAAGSSFKTVKSFDQNKMRNHKSVSLTSEDPSFKPSLQLHSFEDTFSGLREYITINPNTKKTRTPKSLFSSDFKSSSDLPAMESGFRPFNHFAFINGVPGASISTTTESSMMNLIRNEFVKDIVTSNVWNDMATTKNHRQNRQFYPGSGPSASYSRPQSTSFTLGASYANTNTGGYNHHDRNQNHHDSGNNWVGKYSQSHQQNNFHSTTESTPTRTQLASASDLKKKGHTHKHHHHHTTTTAASSSSSSELHEDWLAPRKKKEDKKDTEDAITSTSKSVSSFSSAPVRFPLECEKFHRFGFCPVTLHYPLQKVESIGSRCSTLLTHLIAPLPKTDVRYDVIVQKNMSSVKGKSSSGTNVNGWSWKTFAGRPVCDTKEVKIVPGWAKNEEGEWLVILQSTQWKQEAQISLCANSNSNNGKEMPKCVQRFTAQRLVVLDPENQNLCPVVRSVFLPSACVCLNDNKQHQVTVTTKRSKQHGHHHRNGHSSSHNKTKLAEKKSQSNDDTTPLSSKVISGRSLLTTLFGLDSEPEASSTHGNFHDTVIYPTSSASIETETETESDGKSSEERNALDLENPSNSRFMVIAGNESEPDNDGDAYSQTPQNSKRSTSSTLGSSFMVSGVANSDNINVTGEDNSSSESDRDTDSNG